MNIEYDDVVFHEKSNIAKKSFWRKKHQPNEEFSFYVWGKDDTKENVWEDGVWRGGQWKNGIWKTGIWETGSWLSGIWEDGIWKTGWWQDGIWKTGVWEHGVWKKGTWEDGFWKSGIWYGGTWEDGVWYSGNWKGGTWKSGWIVDNDKVGGFESDWQWVEADHEGKKVNLVRSPISPKDYFEKGGKDYKEESIVMLFTAIAEKNNEKIKELLNTRFRSAHFSLRDTENLLKLAMEKAIETDNIELVKILVGFGAEDYKHAMLTAKKYERPEIYSYFEQFA